MLILIYSNLKIHYFLQFIQRYMNFPISNKLFWRTVLIKKIKLLMLPSKSNLENSIPEEELTEEQELRQVMDEIESEEDRGQE